MTDFLPLLIFPKAKLIPPTPAQGFPLSKLHFPNHHDQIARLDPQLEKIQQGFDAMVSGSMEGLEPEMVLVIEIIGSVDDFKKAIDGTPGLEWLGEWDIDDIPVDEYFYKPVKIGVTFFKGKIEGVINKKQSKAIRQYLIECGFIDKQGEVINNQQLPDNLQCRDEINQLIKDKQQANKLSGRLFLSYSNKNGLDELLSLWCKWKNKQTLPRGKIKWRDVFTQIKDIRRWGIEETLGETGMINRWHELLEPVDSHPKDVVFQIELFYRKNKDKRQQNEQKITELLENIGGNTINNFIDIPDIAFHAVKAKLPAQQIIELLDNVDNIDIELFNFSSVMYFRPTGQNTTDINDDLEGENFSFTQLPQSDLLPVAAILDGVPSLQHQALKNRLIFDDPNNLSATYQAGNRRHGTAMASLVIHGDLSSNVTPLSRPVYCLPVMEIKLNKGEECSEGFSDEIFFEDRIERAVRRIFEGEGDVLAQAPNVKIINISLGDNDRPFIHFPSPWARLLDWLSFKYQVLFCVSAGNYNDDIDIGMPFSQFSKLADKEKQKHIIKCINQQLSQRRLLSPAESLNAITVGALNTDESGNYYHGNCIDLLADNLFSPISRFGHGFRKSIKPDIYFAGGKQLYNKPYTNNGVNYTLNSSTEKPGQRVAFDSDQQGNLSKTNYTCGTSNAAALATHNSARIYEVLFTLQAENNEDIPDNLMAVLIKTLLVHGAKQNNEAKEMLKKSLNTNSDSRRFKTVIDRYLGYGAVDVERVLACTEQRGTVLACNEISAGEVHEYSFPLPLGLSGKEDWRRMTITLAWFSPINVGHRNLREAKLFFEAPINDKSELNISRTDAEHNQVKKGTVQHEILEGKNKIYAYQDGAFVRLQITCKKDAAEELDSAIPYGLAVTLEVADDVNIPIYQQIRERIQPQIAVNKQN